MTQQPDPTDAPPARPALKVPDPEVNDGDPWADDVLGRRGIADRLTSIVRGQEEPFVISIDGRWGTGKTFLLKRWAQDLRNQDTPWEAIYFNAWEDDFNDDPLLAIIGQLSEYFDEGPLREIARGVAGALGHVLVRRVTGASPDDFTPDSLLNDYREGLRTKKAVKDRLEEIGKKVRDDTGQPLVFIVDELDRCRPTFAIELLERVKHIFDVPNIVFVFGINRGELLKSLESVYGEIDAGTYLRRFFDMEFVLPEADPAAFCSHLVSRFGLEEFFEKLRPDPNWYFEEGTKALVPVVLGRMGLSLRDTDYCVRVMAIAASEAGGAGPIFPELFVLLVATKITNPSLYRRFTEGDATAVDLIDNLNHAATASPADDPDEARAERSLLNWVEAAAYNAADPQAAREELLHVKSRAGELRRPLHISEETSLLDPRIEDEEQRLSDLIRMLPPEPGYHPFIHYGRAPRLLPPRIDLYTDFVRR